MRNYRAQVGGRAYVAGVEPVDKDRLRVKLEGEEFVVERVVRGDVTAWKILLRRAGCSCSDPVDSE